MFVLGREIIDDNTISDFINRHELDEYFKDPSNVFHQNIESDLLIHWRNDTAITIRGYNGTSDMVRYEATFKDNDEILLISQDTITYSYYSDNFCTKLSEALKYSIKLSCHYSGSGKKYAVLETPYR